MPITTQAAILWGTNQPWSVEEVELGDPVAGEVRVKLAASGMCHSDQHVVTGDTPAPFPFVGGHEGAGVVDMVGPGVTTVKEGDHVVLGFIPSCGRCLPCSTGHQNLCDLGAHLLGGVSIADGTHRMTAKGQGVAPMCLLGTFCPYVVVHEASVIPVEPDLPLDKAALVGCGVTTGWGSAVHTAQVEPGDTVVVVGIGGVGGAAIQGAKNAGAKYIVAVDPVEFKREQAQALGATHAVEDVDKAFNLVQQITYGRMADKALITVGVINGDLIAPTMSLIGKGGTVVPVAIGNFLESDVKLNLFEMTLYQKSLKGAIFGGGNPRADIPKLLSMYREGQLKLDEMITKTYKLEDINQGYEDMLAGNNIRGVIMYD